MLSILLHLAGGVALLAWGLHMVESGFMRAFGASLRRIMARSLGNRFRAFCAGLGVTAALQSSTATGLIATSFTARGLMEQTTALAVMLGANVGSTLIVQAFSLDLSLVSPICLVVGMILFERGRDSRAHDVGRAIIGLGLMLLALGLLVSTMKPAEAAPALRTILGAVTDQPLLNAGIAALITWATHSSVPVVLFVASLSASHAIPMPAALAMVLGANVGSALTPYFEGLKGGDNLRKRLPSGNLLIRGGVCIVLLGAVNPLAGLIEYLPRSNGERIADFHTLLNLAIAIAFIGFLGPIARLLEKSFPDNSATIDPDAPRYLDSSAVETPTLALACATREALHMSDIVEDMLNRSLPALLGNDRKLAAEIGRRDNAVDRLYEGIKLYVTRASRESLEPEEAQRAMAIIAFVINMEHIGDILDRNLMELAVKKIKNQLNFSDEGAADLRTLHAEVLESFRRAQAVFVSGDVRMAAELLEHKSNIRNLEREAADKHFVRLREGRIESITSSALHLDVLRDLKQIHSHICAIAYPVLDQAKQHVSDTLP